ncbi:capsular biosynthesis protein [bacterium (Candidatus Torokbacteria) CG_4_10_14_0_2_um_filter_35_8]|nr:MAG: capsular biosynthesis protein [bacterium (Candidatus Torokbacteria) CG_4_10_14_0_2_um_filter_35_8]
MPKKFWKFLGFIPILLVAIAGAFLINNEISGLSSDSKEALEAVTLNKEITDNGTVLSSDLDERTSDYTPGKEEETVTIVAVGDIMLSRTVDTKMRAKKNYRYPYLKTYEITQDADITFGNLETSITPGKPVSSGQMMFRADPESATALFWAGFDIVSLANNHTPNYGQKGLLDTFKYLDKNNIEYVGAGKNLAEARSYKTIEKKGIKISFLAYNDSDVVPASYQATSSSAGTAFMSTNYLKEDVKKARQNSDIVIVSMHSGTEYVTKPNSRQVKFAHAAIDYGADMVIGHHPHIVQVSEVYKNKYIVYSLGNFIFDQMWSEETRLGAITKITLNKEGIIMVSFVPVKIYDYCQPRVLTEEKQEGMILDRLKF